jgi:hypothetical protein
MSVLFQISMSAWVIFFALMLVCNIKKQATGDVGLLTAGVTVAVGSIALVSLVAAVIARIWL